MRELRGGNLWTVPHAKYICVTTNNVIKSNGEAVMGKGIALQAVEYAARTFNGVNLPLLLAEWLRNPAGGSHVGLLRPTNIISFPTKYDWRCGSSIALIRQSAKELMALIHDPAFELGPLDIIALSPPGCSNGGLDWETQVRPAIADILCDDRFVVVLPR
jgi:hypothetical protein